jgi:hypothetical protein
MAAALRASQRRATARQPRSSTRTERSLYSHGRRASGPATPPAAHMRPSQVCTTSMRRWRMMP